MPNISKNTENTQSPKVEILTPIGKGIGVLFTSPECVNFAKRPEEVAEFEIIETTLHKKKKKPYRRNPK